MLPSGEVLLVRLRPEAPIIPEVLLFYLRSPEGYAQIQELVRGSTGHLYPGDLGRLQVPARIFGEHSELSLSFAKASTHFRAYRKSEDAANALAHSSFHSTAQAPDKWEARRARSSD